MMIGLPSIYYFYNLPRTVANEKMQQISQAIELVLSPSTISEALLRAEVTDVSTSK